MEGRIETNQNEGLIEPSLGQHITKELRQGGERNQQTKREELYSGVRSFDLDRTCGDSSPECLRQQASKLRED